MDADKVFEWIVSTLRKDRRVTEAKMFLGKRGSRSAARSSPWCTRGGSS